MYPIDNSTATTVLFLGEGNIFSSKKTNKKRKERKKNSKKKRGPVRFFGSSDETEREREREKEIHQDETTDVDVVDRQSADDGGAAAQPQAAPARDDGLRAVAGRRRSHLLRLQPAADGVALHPSGLDLRRHPLPALSLLLLRQRRRLGPQYGPHHRQPVSPSILSFLLFLLFFFYIFSGFFLFVFFWVGGGE